MVDDDFFEELLIAEDELIDEYLGDSLGAREKQDFEKYFLTTTERRRKLQFAQALRQHVATATTPQFKPQRERRLKAWLSPLFASYAGAALAALIILAVGLGVWRIFFYQSETEKGLLALQAAYHQQRPTEARISGFNYAPLITVRGDAPEKVDTLARGRAERILLDAAHDNPGAASSHALGKLYLAARKFDPAIEYFEAALKSDAGNPQLQSDLGAALLEKGKAIRAPDDDGKSVEAFAKSLEHLNKALELNGSLLEALFNRSLCYHYMMLLPQEEEAWRKYLERDANSPWAEEARRQLEAIEEQKNRAALNPEQSLQDFLSAHKSGDDDAAWKAISPNRNVTGSTIENNLLDAYLSLTAKGNAKEANENFKALTYASELEKQRANDYFLAELVQFYRATLPARLSTLIEARALMKLGHAHLQQFEAEEAIDYYTRARLLFERAGDVGEAQYVEYPLAHCYLLQSKSEVSLAAFENVARACKENRYRWLLAQSLNAIANAQMSLNNYSLALDSSQRSLAISEQINDISGVIKTKAQLAQEYLALGNYRKSLSFNQQSLALALERSKDPLQLWRSYYTIAMPLNFLGLTAAAVEFEKESLRLALAMNTPQTICRSYVNLGLIYGGQRNFDEAIKNIQLALELSKSISSQKVRMETLAYSVLQLGHVYRHAGAFDQAAASYNQAIQTYSELGYNAFNYVARKGKLLSCLAHSDCSPVEEEMQATFELFEGYRSKILEESNRDSFFDTEQNICDVAVEYALTKGDSQRAFEYAERCRARSLLDQTGMEIKLLESAYDKDLGYTLVSQPLGRDELQARLPPQAQILQFAVLDDKLVIWLITSTDFKTFEQRITAKELNEKVLDYLHFILRPDVADDEEMRRQAGELYEILIRPAAAFLDQDKQLSIVPDKILNYLPYGALISTTSRKYLLEEYALTFAPSSSVFIYSTEAAQKRALNRPERLLSVGNPAFDRRAFPTLDDLPQAVREAEKIASFYSPSPTLVNANATKLRVESEMERADVIHLAMHYVTDEQSPLHSRLLFATESSGSRPTEEPGGVMQAYELYKRKLPLTRLVVLSACQTGGERYYNGEGMIGISRPFIAQGVPLVVASLWPVDSEATAQLMINFHRYRKNEKLSTAEALRRAQRDMINQTASPMRHPFYWAAFTTIGGYAEY